MVGEIKKSIAGGQDLVQDKERGVKGRGRIFEGFA